MPPDGPGLSALDLDFGGFPEAEVQPRPEDATLAEAEEHRAGDRPAGPVVIRNLVREIRADPESTGETPPAPLAERRYGGRFLVRLPPEVHRAPALPAAEAGVSLNRLVSARLAGAGSAPA